MPDPYFLSIIADIKTVRQKSELHIFAVSPNYISKPITNGRYDLY